MSNLTLDPITEQITAALEAAVAERGEDYTYPEEEEHPEFWSGGICVYQLDDGAPACIIGLAARKLNPDVNMSFAAVAADKVIEEALAADVPVRTGYALSLAQGLQDRGQPWGVSLKAYYEQLESDVPMHAYTYIIDHNLPTERL